MRGGGNVGPAGGPVRTETVGGGGVGGEPGGGANGVVGRGGEAGINPWQVTKRGVEKFPIQAPVAAAEAFLAGQELLQARGQVAIGGNVRTQRGKELQEDSALAGGGRGAVHRRVRS